MSAAYVAHDVFAEMNPAFCACAAVRFTEAFVLVDDAGPELPLLYVALPLALSGELGRTFAHVTKATGLLGWIHRSPEIGVGLGARLNGTMGVVTDAFQYACFTHLLRIEATTRIRLGGVKLKPRTTSHLGADSVAVLRHSALLGHWFAKAGSTRAVLDTMGVDL